MDTYYEQILPKIEKSSITMHKKINRLILVNVFLVIILIIGGLVYVFYENHKDIKQKIIEKEMIENWVQEDSLFKKNVWDLFYKTILELENSTEITRKDSVDIFNQQSSMYQNEINADEIDQ